MLDINEFYFPSAPESIAVLETVNPIISEAKTLIIYGAGYNGIQAYRFLKKNGITPDFFCDAAVKKQDLKICDTSIYSLGQLAGIDKDAVIIISPSNGTVPIENQLRNLGFHKFLFLEQNYRRHYWLQGYLSDKDIKDKMVQDNKDKIDYVRAHLSDEKSKAVFDAALQLWLFGDDSGTSRLAEKNEYFPEDIISLHDNEVFVDCGAYISDTIREFIKQTDGRYKYIYSFEADAANYECANMTVALNGFNRVKLYQVGIWSSKDVIIFDADSSLGSRITGDGGTEIPVNSLDNLLLEHVPTYIKMDIEGSELEALKGANRIPEWNYPKLAVCVYHKFGDIWEIPFYIMQNYPQYEIFLRQHAILNETVCYAIKAGEAK